MRASVSQKKNTPKKGPLEKGHPHAFAEKLEGER